MSLTLRAVEAEGSLYGVAPAAGGCGVPFIYSRHRPALECCSSRDCHRLAIGAAPGAAILPHPCFREARQRSQAEL